MTAPETIYLDGDASTDEGVYPRCFNDPKPASDPVNTYHHESICIRRDDPLLRQVMDAAENVTSGDVALQDILWGDLGDNELICVTMKLGEWRKLRTAVAAIQKLISQERS